MKAESGDMADRGPSQATDAEEILGLMESSNRPVWTQASLAEELDVSRPTVGKHIEEVHSDPRVRSLRVGNSTAYYIAEVGELSKEERHRQSIEEAFTDRFVGLPTKPWTAIHPNDGPAVGGDRIQLQVHGVPGHWGSMMRRSWDQRREKLLPEELHDDETQALVSGELYEKPTVPVEHRDYPDDYDLETNVGAEWEEIEVDGRKRQVLVAAGLKNWLIAPCNNAVFLKDVEVDWISVEGEGQTIPHGKVEREDLEALLKEREQQEALENLRGDEDG